MRLLEDGRTDGHGCPATDISLAFDSTTSIPGAAAESLESLFFIFMALLHGLRFL